MNARSTSQEWLETQHLNNTWPINPQNLEVLDDQEEDGRMMYEDSYMI
jgi:hypothetical protein